MAEELAASRTLLVEFREAIEAQSEQKVDTFCKGVEAGIKESVVNIVGHALGVAPEDRSNHDGLAKLAKAVAADNRNNIYCCYEEVFGPVSRITPEQARVMAGLLKNVGELAERFKKLSEGVSLAVDYNARALEMMARFLAMVVMPYCSSEQKALIGSQALKFLPSYDPTMYEESSLNG